MITPYDGLIWLDKPVGPSSLTVAKILGRRLSIKRVGHIGTLDPMASGLLPVVIGKGTRLSFLWEGVPKIYDFTLVFGAQTTTDDGEGSVLYSCASRPSDDRIQKALPSFIGPISQRPPSFSALKVQGKAAYTLARKNIPIELPARVREVYSFSFLKRLGKDCVRMQVKGQSGLYVRALGRDLAHFLKTVGHVVNIRRVGMGARRLSDQKILDFNAQVVYSREEILDFCETFETLLEAIPSLVLDEADLRRIANGAAIPMLGHPNLVPGALWIRKPSGAYVSMARYDGTSLKPWGPSGL